MPSPSEALAVISVPLSLAVITDEVTVVSSFAAVKLNPSIVPIASFANEKVISEGLTVTGIFPYEAFNFNSTVLPKGTIISACANEMLVGITT